jgi:hypothetical protein
LINNRKIQGAETQQASAEISTSIKFNVFVVVDRIFCPLREMLNGKSVETHCKRIAADYN